MRVIQLKPKMEWRQTCGYCATIYMLEESDVTASVCKDDNGNLRPSRDFYGDWNCPGCGRKTSSQLWELPFRWYDLIMARSPGVREEYDSLRKAEKERESRLNTEVRVEYESKFDKLLRCFTFKK